MRNLLSIAREKWLDAKCDGTPIRLKRKHRERFQTDMAASGWKVDAADDLRDRHLLTSWSSLKDGLWFRRNS